MDVGREAHWQARWAEASLAVAKRESYRQKFYALWTYPGTSGFLHVGHLRGLTLGDALHRYYRMLGRSVFFPIGTHASGLPAVAFAQRVADRDPATLTVLKEHGVVDARLRELEDPEEAARFLGRSYLEVYRRFGFLVDETSYLTTIDGDYRAFVRWQLRTLGARGMLSQGPYFATVCPVCGPVSVDASETDLSSGGRAEVVRYTTIPFPLEDGRVLLAATLRPETVYGVTNLWVHPSDPLVVWHHGATPYIVGRIAAERLLEQHGGRLGHEVRPDELLGRSVKVPLVGNSVPVLASPLVAPTRGSGVVMSVPAHAPADWVALGALTESERARVPSVPEIVFVPPEEPLSASEQALRAGSGVPAERAARAEKVRSLDDAEALDRATERLYRFELVHGRMLVAALGPIPVAEARERMEATFEAAGTGFALRELSEPVRCRRGHEVIIRKIPDQWFIRYSDPEWKRVTHSLAKRQKVSPKEYGAELPAIIDWYEDRPCTRKGRWLGTPFPLDESWIIEAIADSTFYPAYFTVKRFVNAGRLTPAQVTDALLDFVFLGKGEGEPTVPRELQEEVRAEFTYWYPLDLNIGGKEHKRVHFPVYLFTHALLLPEELQPEGLFVHGWILSPEGTKISKRHIGLKGAGIPPILGALERWSADGLRLYYCSAAAADQDVEWDPDTVDQASERLDDLARLARTCLADGPGGPAELEAWLSDAMHEQLHEVESEFDGRDLRGAAQRIYVTVPSVLRRFLARGGAPGLALIRAAEAWVRLLSPITPHLAEELGEGRFDRLVAEEAFPRPTGFGESPAARARESYLRDIEEDLGSVLKPALARGENVRGLVFYVAAPWKWEVDGWVRASTRSGPELLREVLERAAAHPELASARGEVAQYLQRAATGPRGDRTEPMAHPGELATLRSMTGYLARRFHCEEVVVHPEEVAAEYDPKNRRSRARPGRPAFYVLAGPAAAPAEGR